MRNWMGWAKWFDKTVKAPYSVRLDYLRTDQNVVTFQVYREQIPTLTATYELSADLLNDELFNLNDMIDNDFKRHKDYKS
jgi:hypothetical protein